MKKSCPACGRPVADEAKLFCPACEKLELSRGGLTNEDFERLSQVITTRLKGDWKFKAQVAGGVILVVLAVIGVIDAILGFNLRDNMARRFENQENQAKKRIDEHVASLDDDVKKTLTQVDLQMRANIVTNFQATVIQAMIQDVAKAEAKGILEGEVQPAVDSFRKDAQFIRTVARAQAYDFKAYQQLLDLANQTNENATLANHAIVEIDRLLQRDRSELNTKKRVLWHFTGTNIYKGPFTSDELALQFSSMKQDRASFNREGFVNTVGELKQPLFLSQLVDFFMDETDLAVADRLTAAISDITSRDFHPRDFARIQSWWKTHRDSYTNWPSNTLELGLREFSSVHYPQAAEAFEQVLKLDSAADMSRAYAIACYWETGETNRAATLAKEFTNPSARWAQWATAKAELESGSRSNATVRFACITTNFPTMDRLPIKGSHVFTNIDWQLFDRLVGTNAP